MTLSAVTPDLRHIVLMPEIIDKELTEKFMDKKNSFDKKDSDFAEKDFCVSCGKRGRDIPRIEYTIAKNTENGFSFPDGGYMCYECEDKSYREAHLDGEKYCPEHGFVESYFNVKDDAGMHVGCFDGCRAAARFDEETKNNGRCNN